MKQNLKELIYLREEELMNLNYSLDRTYLMKKYWKIFNKYCLAKNVDYYDFKMLNLFLKENYNCLIADNETSLNRVQKEAIKAMLILDDVNIIHTFIKYNCEKNELSNYYTAELEKYLIYCKDIRNNGQTTINDKKKNTILFFKYLTKNNISKLNEIKKETIVNYISCLQEELLSVKKERYWNLRCLLNYLKNENILSYNFDYLIPQVKRIKNKNVPTVIEKEDVEKILAQLKKDANLTPSGYRNYAIVLIASKLGIRIIDIKNLKWENINWKENTINFIQMKTRKQLTLPLTNDIGESIIEYLRNERPLKIKDNQDYIFIRNHYPYTKLSNGYNMHEIIYRTLRKCGIPIDKYKKRGLHSFRFTLATELLNEEIPIDIISSILGHSNLNSTRTYLKVDEKHLKECFVEVNYE